MENDGCLMYSLRQQSLEQFDRSFFVKFLSLLNLCIIQVLINFYAYNFLKN